MPLNIPPQARPYRSGARMPDPIGARRAGAERRLLKQREQQNAMAIQKEQEARELDAARNEAFAQAPDINAYRLDRRQAGDRSGWDNSFAMDKTQRQFKQNLQTDQFRAGLTSWSMGDYKGTAVAWGQLPGFESITPGSISKSKNNQVVFTNPQTGEVIEFDPTSLAEASGLLGGKKTTGMTFQQRKDLETHKAGLKPKGAKGTEKIELPNGMSVSVNELVRLYKTQNNIFSEQELFNMEMVDPERADQARKSMAQVPSFFDWAMKTYGVNLRGKTPDPNPKGAKGSTGAPPPGGGTHAPGSGKGTPKFGSVWE